MRSDDHAHQAWPSAPSQRACILAPAPLRQQPEDQESYDFLVGSVIEASDLDRARAEARRCGVATHEALFAMGLSPVHYAAALACSLGVPLVEWDAVLDLAGPDAAAGPAAPIGDRGLRATVAGTAYRVLCAEDAAPGALRRQVAASAGQGLPVALTTRFRIGAALEERWRAQGMDFAVRGLYCRRPADSAGGTMVWTWQVVAAGVAAGLIGGGLSLVPAATMATLAAAAALPFLCITLLRLAALREVLLAARPRRRGRPPPAMVLTDDQLPVYSVLVPLYREARVLPDLVRALGALDYPRAKLEIILVLEASDIETQAAVVGAALPVTFRTVLVPEGGPRTKPKALNYALQFARGEYIAIYDAEDRPQPDQLRRALEMFLHNPQGLGCVQARLNIYNARASWLTRQLTVEYSALFDALLPALTRLGLPVPLGGTSNHFQRATLAAVGGWDPFNVTEDADLGFRLARRGWRTAVLSSTTWEEAPVSLGSWLKQRTRWLKGWIQTYLVHTRRPWQLSVELGLRGTLGFHVLMGGLVLSALTHPLLYLLLAYHAVSGQLLAPAQTAGGAALWTVAWINLACGYLASIGVGAASAWRRGQPWLALSALLMPLCWLLVSAAAYRALYQLATDPYLWEKTEHGIASSSAARASG